MVAHYLTTVLFPLADIVIDIHTGGRSLDFYPCAHMHLVEDRQQRRQMVEGTLAWNTDFAFLYADIAGTGLLPVEAERQGKIVITTEMGGGEPVSAAVHQLTQNGLRNVLVHFGVLAGKKTTRAEQNLPPTRWVQALSRDDYRFAPEIGIYESLLPLGTEVAAGQPVGLIHFLERPDREPTRGRGQRGRRAAGHARPVARGPRRLRGLHRSRRRSGRARMMRSTHLRGRKPDAGRICQ